MNEIISKIDPLTFRTVIGACGGFIICLLIFARSAKPDPEKKTPGQPMFERFGDFAAWFGLALGAFFWCIYWIGLFQASKTQGWMSTALTILGVLFGIAQPTALPWLIAKTFPRETFALHIHKRTIETDAYKILFWTTGAMCVVSFFMVWGWLTVVVQMTDPILRLLVDAMFTALSTLVPSFAMFQIVPKSWKLQLEIEELIEKKERMRYAEEMLIEAQLAQAILLMSIDPLQMAAEQRAANERLVAEIFGSIFVRVNESTRAITRLAAALTRNQSLRIQTMDDQAIYDKMYTLFQTLEKVQFQIEDGQPSMDVLEHIAAPMPEVRAAEQQLNAARDDYDQAERRHSFHRTRAR